MIWKRNNNCHHDGTSAFFSIFFSKNTHTLTPLSIRIKTKIVEIEKKLDGNDLIYKTGNKEKHLIKNLIFKRLKKIRSFERQVYNNNLSLDDTLE